MYSLFEDTLSLYDGFVQHPPFNHRPVDSVSHLILPVNSVFRYLTVFPHFFVFFFIVVLRFYLFLLLGTERV